MSRDPLMVDVPTALMRVTEQVAKESRACEDCAEDGPAVMPRRYRCVHCGLLVCGYCIGHSGHACGPGHSEADCRDRQAVKAMTPEKRRAYFVRLRARTLAAA